MTHIYTFPISYLYTSPYNLPRATHSLWLISTYTHLLLLTSPPPMSHLYTTPSLMIHLYTTTQYDSPLNPNPLWFNSTHPTPNDSSLIPIPVTHIYTPPPSMTHAQVYPTWNLRRTIVNFKSTSPAFGRTLSTYPYTTSSEIFSIECISFNQWTLLAGEPSDDVSRYKRRYAFV